MWVPANQMGPSALWLLESLTEVMTIEPGMKVLDLGCGRAMSSIFLAKEFGARVWATDLWIAAGDNQERIVEAGVSDLVTPIHAEAHTLPFAAGFFDAIVSIDAYQYFGTADLYLGYVLDFLKPGGRIGAVMPATTRELGEEIPATLERFWEWEFCCFHSARVVARALGQDPQGGRSSTRADRGRLARLAAVQRRHRPVRAGVVGARGGEHPRHARGRSGRRDRLHPRSWPRSGRDVAEALERSSAPVRHRLDGRPLGRRAPVPEPPVLPVVPVGLIDHAPNEESP
jgi:SAM-dependent methyltransferase